MLPNHHITKPVLIGEIQDDGQFDDGLEDQRAWFVGDAWSDYLPESKEPDRPIGGRRCPAATSTRQRASAAARATERLPIATGRPSPPLAQDRSRGLATTSVPPVHQSQMTMLLRLISIVQGDRPARQGAQKSLVKSLVAQIAIVGALFLAFDHVAAGHPGDRRPPAMPATRRNSASCWIELFAARSL